MKLRNKKTGEIVDVESIGHADSLKGKFGYQVTLSWKIDEHLCTCKTYNSLAELNEEWEDYEEPKEYWYIDYDGGILCGEKDNSSAEKMMISMGNHFDSLEEAEKAVEKLKAWKRLRDNGLRFSHYEICPKRAFARVEVRAKRGPVLAEQAAQFVEDLDLIFGGKK